MSDNPTTGEREQELEECKRALIREVKQLREQLAAERNKVQTLRDALTIIRDKIYQIAGAKKIATLALGKESNRKYQE